MQNHDLIDRYVHAVGEQLPRTMRSDIEQELRSLLQDTLEEQLPSDEEPSPKIVAEVLRQFGKPEEMAASYRPKQALIGEALFPTYKTVLTIVLAVMAGFHLVLLLLTLFATGMDGLGTKILGFLEAFVQMSFWGVSITTIVFAILERIEGVSAEINKEKSAEWNPLDLPPVKDPDRINRGEMIVGIVFGVLFIIAFNFFFDVLGLVDLAGDEQGFVSVLAEESRRHVPWITASFAFEALLKLVVLVRGRWTRSTRWVLLAEQAFGLFVLYRIFSSPVILITPLGTLLTKVIIAIIMLVVVFEMLGNLHRLFTGNTRLGRAAFQSSVA